MIDIVTVVHNPHNTALSHQLERQLAAHHDSGSYRLIRVDNSQINRGFAGGCNLGASQGEAAVVGLVNPDAIIHGNIVDPVLEVFQNQTIQITGERFDKSDLELATWGVPDWVCGAAFFVRRAWWERLGGFDAEYKWGWEETDFIRRTLVHGGRLRSIRLPISHASPEENSQADHNFKRLHFQRGARIYRERWGL